MALKNIKKKKEEIKKCVNIVCIMDFILTVIVSAIKIILHLIITVKNAIIECLAIIFIAKGHL